MKKTWNIADISKIKHEKFSHWIDWLSFSLWDMDLVSPFFTERIQTLDYDNANWWVTQYLDEIFTIRKHKAPTWDAYNFLVTYNTIPVPIFEIVFFNARQQKFTWSSWIIHFYGSFFRLIELEYFSDHFIKSIDSTFYETPITRIDYRFDFLSKEKHNVPLPQKIFPNLRKNKRGRNWTRPWTWEIESWDLWNKTNKTIFIRFYNKIKELDGNLKKLYLYWDIKDYKTFHRLEYELWYKFCAWTLGKDIWQLLNKVYSMSGIVPWDYKGNLYIPQTSLDLSDELQKNRYIKIFTSMAINLKKNWFDPISIIKNDVRY